MSVIAAANWDEWVAKAAAMLRANRIEIDGCRYTAPATSPTANPAYVHQFLWDSCFHALAYRWFDLAMARDELRALVAAQLQDGPDAGMIPHMISRRGGSEQLWGRPDHSLITQPPLIAVTAMLLHADAPDVPFLAELYPALCAYHAWFDRRRDPDGDGLICLIHPWESGWDASPRWDRAMGLPCDVAHEQGARARAELAPRLVELGCDAGALLRAGSYCVEPVDYNAIRAADLEALGEMAAALDRPQEAMEWGGRAARVREAFQRKMVRDGSPYDLDGADEQPIVQESAAQFIALFGGCLTEAQAERLAAQLRQPRHWPRFPVPTSPTDAPAFVPDQYWRGNVWLSVNWLIYMGLRRYGYVALASELAERSLALVAQSGFWEYYHPLTGQGLGSTPQSWSAIVLDMLGRERGIEPPRQA